MDVSFRGMPRANGQDSWIYAYKNAKRGDSITVGEIERLLEYNGRDNIISEFVAEGDGKDLTT